MHHLAAPVTPRSRRLTRQENGIGCRRSAAPSNLRPSDKRGPDANVDLRVAARFRAICSRRADVLSRYGSNHIHAVPGDFVDDLRVLSDWMDVDFEDLGAPK